MIASRGLGPAEAPHGARVVAPLPRAGGRGPRPDLPPHGPVFRPLDPAGPPSPMPTERLRIGLIKAIDGEPPPVGGLSKAPTPSRASAPG